MGSLTASKSLITILLATSPFIGKSQIHAIETETLSDSTITVDEVINTTPQRAIYYIKTFSKNPVIITKSYVDTNTDEIKLIHRLQSANLLKNKEKETIQMINGGLEVIYKTQLHTAERMYTFLYKEREHNQSELFVYHTSTIDALTHLYYDYGGDGILDDVAIYYPTRKITSILTKANKEQFQKKYVDHLQIIITYYEKNLRGK